MVNATLTVSVPIFDGLRRGAQVDLAVMAVDEQVQVDAATFGATSPHTRGRQRTQAGVEKGADHVDHGRAGCVNPDQSAGTTVEEVIG